MTSPLTPFNGRERVTARSVANEVFPVGRPVFVRIPQSGDVTAKPAATIRYYRSAPGPLPAGSDDCRRTLQPLQASGGFFDRGRGTRPVDLNLGRYLAGWSSRVFSSLRKFCQEPRGVFTVLFRPSLSAVFAHKHHSNSEAFPCQERVFPKTEKEFPRLICVRQ